jgi:cytochrome P450
VHVSGIIEHMTTEPQALPSSVSPLMLEAFEHRQNPYPIYKRFRDEHPMHRSPEGLWTLTRYHDILAVLRDDRFSADPRNATALDSLNEQAESVNPIRDAAGTVLLFTDPPDHTTMRTLVNKAFTPRTVEKLRSHIAELVDELLVQVEGDGMDVIGDFAYPLPALVICELMGVPVKDRDAFKGWSSDVAPILDPVSTPESLTKAMGTISQFGMYFWALIEERRKEPQDDFLSALIAAEENDQKLSVEQLLALCVLIFIAGHETTQNLIGNGLLALLRNRDQLEMLRDNPSIVRGAVEELLRYDSPVQLTARSATTDIQVADTTIPKGEEVIVLLGAGNRDPSVFPDPDRLDITREKSQVVSFGGGAHFCLGAGLARLEGEIAFPALLKRFPNIELGDTEPQFRPTFTLRGLESLEVRF